MDAAAGSGGTGKGWVDGAVSYLMESVKETSNASLSALDAYKTYLYRKGNKTVQQIEGIKAGQPIDLTEINAEITAVEKTILMCKSAELPTYEEQYKLKGLKALRDQLIGRTWPSLADINAQVKAEQKKAADKQAMLAVYKVQLQEQKAGNGNSQFVNKYQKPGGPWKPIPKKLVPKPKPQPKPLVEIGATVGIDQEWIMRIGMASNCNVSIMRDGNVYMENTVLRCKVCSTEKRVADRYAVSTNVLIGDIEVFCRAHRHDQAPVASPAGRFFRDDE